MPSCAIGAFDVSKKDLADVDHLGTEAEKIVALGLAEEEEQAAIIDLNIVEKQRDEDRS
jgi:hypothetical protein